MLPDHHSVLPRPDCGGLLRLLHSTVSVHWRQGQAYWREVHWSSAPSACFIVSLQVVPSEENSSRMRSNQFFEERNVIIYFKINPQISPSNTKYLPQLFRRWYHDDLSWYHDIMIWYHDDLIPGSPVNIAMAVWTVEYFPYTNNLNNKNKSDGEIFILLEINI